MENHQRNYSVLEWAGPHNKQISSISLMHDKVKIHIQGVYVFLHEDIIGNNFSKNNDVLL